jgi:hypothetical protein
LPPSLKVAIVKNMSLDMTALFLALGSLPPAGPLLRFAR